MRVVKNNKFKMTGSGAAMAAKSAAKAEKKVSDEDVDEVEMLVSKASSDSKAAMDGLLAIVNTEGKSVKVLETAINQLAILYASEKKAEELNALLKTVRPLLTRVSKAKGGKLVRHIIDQFLKIDGNVDDEVALVVDSIEWTKEANRRFLRQTLEIILASLNLKARKYQDCLAVAQPLIKELKRLDDKLQLVEVQLVESRAYYALSNYPKSRAALVSARTTANGVYCPPKMQAALDIQSGITHAQEHDFKTAFSYFYEAFEGFDSTETSNDAIRSLKYMLLCKIMLEAADDVPGILSGKLALKYSSDPQAKTLDAMRAIATAKLKRSLEMFEQALLDYKTELADDVIIQSHVESMYDNMLQSNLLRIVEPYSSIEIEHIAKLIKLPLDVVETKLSQMILDKKLVGILDQGAGCLEIFDNADEDPTFAAAIETIQHTGTVVEALYKKAKKLK